MSDFSSSACRESVAAAVAAWPAALADSAFDRLICSMVREISSEAAACCCPVVMGPHTFNFAHAAEMALQAGAAWREDGLDAAVARALALSSATEEWAAACGKAQRFAQAHAGAARSMAARILADS